MSVYGNNVLATDNLLGLWVLGEPSGTTFADTSGAGHTFTISGGVTLNQTGIAVGDATKAATFNGTTGYAAASANTIFDFAYTQPFAVEALLNVTTISNGSFGAILAKELRSGNFTGWFVGITGTGSNNFQAVFLILNDLSHQLFIQSSVTMAPGDHHVHIAYSGSGTPAGVSIWIDGILDKTPTIVNQTFTNGNISNTAIANIGGANSGAGAGVFFPGKLQYVALYGASAPNGSASTQAGYTNQMTYNIKASANHSLGLIGATAVADPVVPNVIIGTDMAGDIDDAFDTHILCALHYQRKINIIGAVVASGQVDSAGATQSIFDFWRVTAPVYSTFNGSLWSTSKFATQVVTRFEAGDLTNKGVTAVASIVGGGTAYVVGDVLIVPGGTVATKRGRAATLTVSAVTAGVITAFSISNSGSYSTVPPGTAGVITLPNPHGGTAATVTLTTTVSYGNYTNGLSGVRQLLANNSNVLWLELGFATGEAQVLASASNAGGDGLSSGATLITNSVISLVWVAGEAYSYNDYPVSVGNPEFNMQQDSTSANALVSGSPKWPTAIIESGIELATTQDNTTGLIDIKPPTTLDPNTNPMKYAYDQYVANGGNIDASNARIWYSVGGILYAFEGIGGNRLYWGTIGGTETINSSTGANSLVQAAGTPPWSVLRKRASDTALTAYGNAMLGTLPPASRSMMIF